MATKTNVTDNTDDIKVGVNIVQPTEEKLTLLGSTKIKLPKNIMPRENKKIKDKKTMGDKE